MPGPAQTAPAPAAPASSAGPPTLDGVLEKGEELRVRVHEDIAEHRETYRRNAGGLRVVPLYEALRESVSASRARKLAEEYRARPEDQEAEDEGAGEIASEILWASDALQALHLAYRRSAFRALCGEREMGDGVVPGVAFAPGSHGRARYAIECAADAFPTDWLLLSRATGPIKATMGGRGLYRSWPKPGYPSGMPLQPLAKARIRVERDALYENAVHEWGHRFQDVVGGLTHLEGDLYQRRTTRPDGTRAPARRLPGYRRDDLFCDGGFFTAYAGRDPFLDAEEPCPGFEVFPCGVEAMFGGDLYAFEDFYLHADAQHEAFVLGCLATL